MEIKFEFKHPCGVILEPGRPGTKEIMRFSYKSYALTLVEDEVPDMLIGNFRSTHFNTIMMGLEAVVQSWDKPYGKGRMDFYHSVYQAWADWVQKKDREDLDE